MQFLASAITLLICGAMILAFRQHDKSNNSMEKTRRYAEKLQGDFSIFVKEQTNGLTDVANELSVQQSQAVAAVKRLDSIYVDFMKKAENLEERAQVIRNIDSHVEKSENTIQKLMDMTKLAEKNLAQISKESDFVETLSQSIGNAKLELNQIADSIPEMKKQFAEESLLHLENYKTEILKQMNTAIMDIEGRLGQSQKASQELFDVTSIKLNDLYKNAFQKATKNANELEDEAFKTLKEESIGRVKQYRQELADYSNIFEKQINANLSETKDLAENFKKAWKEEAAGYITKMQDDFAEIQNDILRRTDDLTKRVNETEGEVLLKSKKFDTAVKQHEAEVNSQINSVVSNLQNKIAELTKYSDKRLSEFKTQTDYKMKKFEHSITDFDKLEEQFKDALKQAKDEVLNNFENYKSSQLEDFSLFSQNFEKQSDSIDLKIKEIETNIDDIKTKAYGNVSKKFKVFEDEFLADISKRREAINNNFETWKNEVNEKLTLIGSEHESERKDIEDEYKKDLQVRLNNISESHKSKLSGFDKQIADIESELSNRLSAADAKMLEYANQFQEQIDKAKESSHQYMQKELDTYKLELQESIKNHNRDVETNAKKVNNIISTLKEDSEDQISLVKGSFDTWKNSVDQQFNDARNLFDDKISNFATLAENAIANFNSKYNSEYTSFLDQSTESFDALRQQLSEVDTKIEEAKKLVSEKSEESQEQLQREYENFNVALDKKFKSSFSEADKSIHQIKESIQAVRVEVDRNKSDMVELIQTDTSRLKDTISTIEEKQNEYLSQTKVFERVDDLKTSLETDISRLQGEVTRLEIYSDAMDELKIKYDKVTHLQDEATQKISRFMDERTRIELLEQEFTKLATLSDSIDKKQIELAASNDDMQQYQIQIRKLEESITKVNTRYDYLEKKDSVLDQTTKGIDTAFENLKSVEAEIKSFREIVTNMPSQVDQLQKDINLLLDSREDANSMLEKIGNIDEILNDLDGKMLSLNNSREWLAATEKRLKDIHSDTDKQIKLMASLFQNKDNPRALRTSLSIAERENVISLHRKGWSVDEIVGAMKCSYGEVELILEISDNYDK